MTLKYCVFLLWLVYQVTSQATPPPCDENVPDSPNCDTEPNSCTTDGKKNFCQRYCGLCFDIRASNNTAATPKIEVTLTTEKSAATNCSDSDTLCQYRKGECLTDSLVQTLCPLSCDLCGNSTTDSAITAEKTSSTTTTTPKTTSSTTTTTPNTTSSTTETTPKKASSTATTTTATQKMTSSTTTQNKTSTNTPTTTPSTTTTTTDTPTTTPSTTTNTPTTTPSTTTTTTDTPTTTPSTTTTATDTPTTTPSTTTNTPTTTPSTTTTTTNTPKRTSAATAPSPPQPNNLKNAVQIKALNETLLEIKLVMNGYVKFESLRNIVNAVKKFVEEKSNPQKLVEFRVVKVDDKESNGNVFTVITIHAHFKSGAKDLATKHNEDASDFRENLDKDIKGVMDDTYNGFYVGSPETGAQKTPKSNNNWAMRNWYIIFGIAVAVLVVVGLIILSATQQRASKSKKMVLQENKLAYSKV